VIPITGLNKIKIKEINLEVEIALTLNHENIIKTYGSKKTEDKLYIFMEYCPFGNLCEALIKRKRFSEMATKVITY